MQATAERGDGRGTCTPTSWRWPRCRAGRRPRGAAGQSSCGARSRRGPRACCARGTPGRPCGGGRSCWPRPRARTAGSLEPGEPTTGMGGIPVPCPGPKRGVECGMECFVRPWNDGRGVETQCKQCPALRLIVIFACCARENSKIHTQQGVTLVSSLPRTYSRRLH